MNTGVPDQIGSYVILEEIGHGGMGVVYRGIHRETGVEVAIKTVYIQRESQLDSIRREIRALARIHHPGVVTVLDQGVRDGLPWYAMNLLKGITLRQYAINRLIDRSGIRETRSTLPDGPTRDSHAVPSDWMPHLLATTLGDDLPVEEEHAGDAEIPSDFPYPELPAVLPDVSGTLPDLLRIFYRLCVTLSYLHGEGIVHRDLKPSNIILQPDGMPVIMDFGLVVRFWGDVSREELEAGSHAGGTMLYIAPEQIMDTPVDARADLYSLGCLMYELLTGHVPFRVDSVESILKAQLYAEPPPPSRLVNGIPPELDAMILKLLAKRPIDRIGHADDVAADLRRLGADTSGVEGFPRSKSYLYRPGFAGREAVFQEVETGLRSLDAGVGEFILVDGTAGIGKTRFLMELARTGRRLRCHVVSSECAPHLHDLSHTNTLRPPLFPLKRLLQSIADYCLGRGPELTAKIIGKHRNLLAMYEPRFRELLTDTPDQPLPELPPDAARLRLFTALTQILSAFCAERPLLIILDDLHWSDDLTVGYLSFLLRTGHLGRMRCTLIASYLPEDAGDAIERLQKSTSVRRIRLERLTEPDIGMMVAEMLAMSSPPETLTHFLFRMSDGNPFFVAEYLRSAVAEGLLFRGQSNTWQVGDDGEHDATMAEFEALPLPRSLSELLDHRFLKLSEGASAILRTAAVLGREFEVVLLWHIVQFNDSVLDAIDELTRRQVLEEPVPGKLRFSSDMIRQLMLRRTPRADLAELHRKAAEAIEFHFPATISEMALQLGYHWEEAGDGVRAADYLTQAARQAKQRSALKEAEHLYRKAIHLSDRTAPSTLSLQCEFVRTVLILTGQFKAAQEQYEATLAEARRAGDRRSEAEALLGLSEVVRIFGRLADSLQDAADALAISRALDDRKLEAAGFRALGKCRMEQGDLDGAMQYYESALEIHRAVGDRISEASVSAHIARVRSNQGRMNEALILYEQAMLIYRQLNEIMYQGPCLVNIAVIHHEQGRFERALSVYQESLEIHRRIGDLRSEAVTLSNIASLLPSMNRADEAGAMYLKALEILRDIGDRGNEGKTLRSYAMFLHQQGDPVQARNLLEQALGIHREVDDRYSEIRALRHLATMHADEGNLGEAFRLLDETLSLERKINRRLSEAVTLYHLAGLKRRATGDLDAAGELIRGVEMLAIELNNPEVQIVCLCERGHIELARGRACRNLLEDAKTRARDAHLTSESERSKAIQRLERAIIAFERNAPLFRGECPDDLSESFRIWLARTGQFTEPQNGNT